MSGFQFKLGAPAGGAAPAASASGLFSSFSTAAPTATAGGTAAPPTVPTLSLTPSSVATDAAGSVKPGAQANS
jgi:hypothetical protein